ncbi:MAG: porin family protein [Dysgonamonadaceae bacterium]|jgi:hypothetical protein|nr:porin family protein [Dysgonamonadaceae bacterium]
MKKLLVLTGILLCSGVFSALAQRPSETGKLISFTEGGALVGNPDNENDAPFIFHSSLNYAFHKNLSAGLGLGVEFIEETLLPVSANLLYQFGDKKIVSPFIRLLAGYQFPLEDKTYVYNSYMRYTSDYIYWPYYTTPEKLDSKGGFMVNPSAGFVFYTKYGLGIALTAGYRYQKLNYQGSEDYSLHVEYNRLSLTLGVIF